MLGYAVAVFLLAAQFDQNATGELRLTVTDAGQLPLAASVDVVSDINQVRDHFDIDASGALIARRLPFGVYRLTVSRDGFAPFVGTVTIQSALPVAFHVTLAIAAVQAQVTVTPPDTLLDSRRTTTSQRIGEETIRNRMTALPGRSLPDLVNSQPGWLLEANGVLHPRGSEYQTQYVVDGLPLTDNRSPAFAPELDADEAHALNILTSGYPAEYGRKLGGVIEVVTAADARRGVHGALAGSIGSFDTKSGDATLGYGRSGTALTIVAGVAATDRYLDPPVEENFTNHGSTSHVAVHFGHDLGPNDRVGAIARYGQNHFLVPNERIQQEAGQEQRRSGHETTAQFSYQHIFSADVLGDVRGMVRDLTAALESNAAATPIVAQQDRGLRDLYVRGIVSLHAGSHEWKLGGDVVAGTVREQFAYRITDADRFDPNTPLAFAFHGEGTDREHSLFVQDRIQLGRWTVNAGVRWDHYRLVVEDTAISPRLGLAWAWPGHGLVMRASYDRAFQTPAVENLLLASSPSVEVLSDNVIRLPVRPSRGNFYEAGLSKSLFRALRVDASYFDRQMTEFADDDLLLDTGVSFPIAFRRAEIRGFEAKLDLPSWNRLTASLSYANQRGTGFLPVTGGLLLADDAASALGSSDHFPITQDQRHTIRGRGSYQFSSRIWGAAAIAYGSGLPFEFVGDRGQALLAYGPRIVSRVDFETGRVRPSLSLDASAGVTLATAHTRKLAVQFDVRNIADRLNVVNFAGLFSGTAIAPPRSVAVRLRADF